MSNQILTSLTGLSTPASGDFLYIVDISDTSDNAAGSSRKITYANLTGGATSTELGYVSGVTSAIQTQINTKQAIVSGVSDTEIGYLDGVTSAIQTQITAKAAKGANSDITSLAGLTTALSVAQGGSGATTLTGILKGNGTSAFTAVTAPTGTIVGTSDTQTLTNKRMTRRVVTVTQAAEPTINTDNTDVAYITGLAQAITSMTTNLSGTPVNGDSLIISITDNGTARAITWGASFESSGNVTLPTTTVLSVRLDVGLLWNVATNKWRCVASS